MKVLFLVMFSLVLTQFTSTTYALDLNGCWQSSDAVLRDPSGKELQCASGIYMHLRQDKDSFEIKLLDYDCNQNVPLNGKVGPFKISADQILNGTQSVGLLNPNSTVLSITDDELGTMDRFSWTLEDTALPSKKLVFHNELTFRDVARTVKGSLIVTPCLE